jgi:uncharacterized protein YjiS (DUF1127 family)
MWSIANARPALRPGSARIVGSIARLICLVELALEVRRERRMLLSLDDRILRDMGLSRYDAWAEAYRSLWDIPCHRLWP